MNQHSLHSDIERARASERFKVSAEVIPGVAFLADLLGIAAAALLSVRIFSNASDMDSHNAGLVIVVIGFLYFAQAKFYGFYKIGPLMSLARGIEDVFIAVAVALMLLFSFYYAFEMGDTLDRGRSLSFAAGMVLFMTLNRVLLRAGLVLLTRRGIVGHNLAVLGAGEQGRRFVEDFRRSRPEFVRVLGIFSLSHGDPREIDGVEVRGGVEDLMELARQGFVDDVVIAAPWNADAQLARIIEALKEMPINVYLSWHFTGYNLSLRPVVSHASNQSLLEVAKRPITGWGLLLKKLEDYVLASLLIVLFLPILLAVAFMIRLDSPGPILFRQERLGFNNKVFQIYKFRSMRHSPEKETVVRQASRNDNRVTRVGRFIRATSIDELPQLFNVLEGTMSLVGPRPHALSHNEEYGRQICGYFARHRVKPGITGWAQVNGLRGETETLDQMEARIRYDIYYAANWSLLFDLKILVMTGLLVLFQKSAY